MGAFNQGINLDYQNQPQIMNDISVVAINWFPNRCPLVTRVPRGSAASSTFYINNRTYRTRATTLGASVADGTTTSITLADASSYQVGDVLELASGERIEISADPNTATNVITVKRAVEGTTGAAQSNGTAVTLIGNSRTGGEIDQTGIAFKPVQVTQYCQTWQHPVQVSGSAQATRNWIGQPGVRTPFEQYKMDALQNLMDDMEVTSYYGIGDAPASNVRPKQKGVKTLISTNKTTSPTNAGAYKPTDFIRDTVEKCRSGGGDPDVLIVSTNFMSGLSTWGLPAQRLDAGATIFGVRVDAFEVPFLAGLTFVEAPLLKPFSTICLTSSEVRLDMKRNEFWNQRGNRGDAFEGEYIAEGAIVLENEAHHAWLEGVTAFSAT